MSPELSNILKKIEGDKAKKAKADYAAAQVKKLASMSASEKKFLPPPPPPVAIKVSAISKNGDVSMKFNQPLTVPTFIEAINSGGSGRRLAGAGSIEEIDISEFLLFEMVKNDDAKPSESNFSVVLK